jgi:arylsulfatase A-like enzyme
MPFLARLPGLTHSGSVAVPMSLNVDFAPTFLDLAGAAVPGDMQGRSLRPVLAGESPKDWRSSMYYHYYEYPGVHAVRRHYGVRTEQHKLIHYYYGMDEWELFDLKADPDELRNVYDDPAYAGIRDTLRTELDRLRKELKLPADEQPKAN